MTDDETEETVRAKSLDVGMLKGAINGVTVKVYSDFADGNHTISFCLSTTGYGEPEIKRNGHEHPWGDDLLHEVEEYAADAKAAREEAWNELERRNLDDPSEWHDSSL